MEKKINKEIYKTLIYYNILFLIVSAIFYFVIPIFLNYPPDSINTEFEKTIDMGFNYYVQYIFTVIVVMFVSNTIFIHEIRKIKGWSKYLISEEDKDRERLNKIKISCVKIPIKLYIIHAIVPSLGTFIGLIAVGSKFDLSFKISVCLLALFITLGLLIYVFSKRLFEKVLIEMRNTDIFDTKINLNSYKSRFFFQFLPLVLLMGTYAYLLVSSVAIEQNGQLLFTTYDSRIKQISIEKEETLDEAIDKLNKISKYSDRDTRFIISQEGVLYQDTDTEITDFFIKYTFDLDNNYHTYGYYASDLQGIYRFVEINGQKCAIGIMYDTSLSSGYSYIFIVLIWILFIVVVFLEIFSDDFTSPIKQISEYMNRLASGEKINYDEKIPVTSNDELGELTVNFNKILDLEKKNFETIERNKEALVESERLSSLGQLIGGVAHNLKTPIMSISGNLQGLQDLILEYDTSIGDPEVNEQDHKDIAKDMKELVEKTRVHLSYMSDVISAVKGQAVELDSSQQQLFSASEVVSRVEILMRHELKNALVELNTQLDEKARTSYIKGDINSLVQVINNLIQNSIYAYNEEKNKVIELKVDIKDNNVCFSVKDYGCGIPENVKQKLFKEMITTKGKNGTGLGLYMSYSTIRGKFNGRFEYESEVGKGTTFYITIPISEE